MAEIDSYTPAGNSSYILSSGYDNIGAAQSFTGNGYKVESAVFKLMNQGSASGNIYAKIYAHNGTFGTNGKPTGAALATSDAVAASGLSFSSYDTVTFNFSGANQITPANGTKYVIACEFSGGDEYSWLNILIQNVSPSHSGNASGKSSAGVWTGSSSADLYFIVNGSPAAANSGFLAFF